MVMTLEGEVIKGIFGKGSKSEREAVFIKCDDKDYVLRRVGGSPFKDNVLESLVGKYIKAEGNVLGSYTFLMKSWEEIESPKN